METALLSPFGTYLRFTSHFRCRADPTLHASLPLRAGQSGGSRGAGSAHAQPWSGVRCNARLTVVCQIKKTMWEKPTLFFTCIWASVEDRAKVVVGALPSVRVTSHLWDWFFGIHPPYPLFSFPTFALPPFLTSSVYSYSPLPKTSFIVTFLFIWVISVLCISYVCCWHAF